MLNRTWRRLAGQIMAANPIALVVIAVLALSAAALLLVA